MIGRPQNAGGWGHSLRHDDRHSATPREWRWDADFHSKFAAVRLSLPTFGGSWGDIWGEKFEIRKNQIQKFIALST